MNFSQSCPSLGRHFIGGFTSLASAALPLLGTIAIQIALLPNASAAPTDCLEQGGQAVCSSPQVSAWGYGLCDEAAPYVFRMNAWCTARNGTIGPQVGQCSNYAPDEESNLYSRSQTFTNLLHPAPAVCSGTDTGWGQTVSSSMCWSGSPTYTNGVLTLDFRRMNFSCNGGGGEIISAIRSRSVICPPNTGAKVVLGRTVCVHQIDPNQCGIGNPVLPGTGKKSQIEADGVFEGRPLTRTYNSQGSIHQYSTDPGSPDFDLVWRESFDIRLELVSGSTYVMAALSLPDGTIQYFRPNGTPVLSTQTNDSRLAVISGGYQVTTTRETLRFDSTGQLKSITLFSGLGFAMRYADGTTGPSGQVAVDADGNSLGVAVPAGRLVEVLSSTGRSLRYARDITGRITQIAWPGTSALNRYYYASDSHLAKVVYPDGQARLYHYNEGPYTSGSQLPDALTGISEVGVNGVVVRYATFGYDSSGRAISTQHSNGVDKFLINPTVPYQTATITDPVGSVLTQNFSNVLGVIKFTGSSQPAGSGCAASTSTQTFDANGNLASRDDFNGKRACYANDPSRNLETVRVEGLANTAVCSTLITAGAALPTGSRKVSTQWHPDWRLEAKLAEPGRITTKVYNGQPDPFNGNAIASCAPSTALLPDGKPIVVLCKSVEQATTDANGAAGFSAALQSGVANRTTTWTYNAVGQVLTEDGPRTDVADITTYTYHTTTTADYTIGDLKTVTNAAGKVTTYSKYNKHGQLLESTDPNGVLTVNTYDLRQRLKTTTVGTQTISYDYDPVGQLKKITQPDGSWLGYDYDDAHRQVAMYDHLGNRVDYTLDNAGNRTAETVKNNAAVLKRQLSRSIDALGRVQQTIGRE